MNIFNSPNLQIFYIYNMKILIKIMNALPVKEIMISIRPHMS